MTMQDEAPGPTGGRGFVEIPHTADWALKVWAPDLSSLLEEAARGMYMLMGVRVPPGVPADRRQAREIKLLADDCESLLVGFLSELLFYLEDQRLVFDQIRVEAKDFALVAWLAGAEASGQSKEIKAVTYHNLVVERENGLLTAVVVFDV
jgi:SHS2 domain-containing protein